MLKTYSGGLLLLYFFIVRTTSPYYRYLIGNFHDDNHFRVVWAGLVVWSNHIKIFSRNRKHGIKCYYLCSLTWFLRIGFLQIICVSFSREWAHRVWHVVCAMYIYVFLIDINKLVPRYQIMNTLKIWISRNSGRKYHHLKLKLSDINRKMTEISYVWNSQKVIHTHINPWFVYPLFDILSTEIKINVDTSTSEHTVNKQTWGE